MLYWTSDCINTNPGLEFNKIFFLFYFIFILTYQLILLCILCYKLKRLQPQFTKHVVFIRQKENYVILSRIQCSIYDLLHSRFFFGIITQFLVVIHWFFLLTYHHHHHDTYIQKNITALKPLLKSFQKIFPLHFVMIFHLTSLLL